MKRLIFFGLLITGILLLLTGSVIYAQDDDEEEANVEEREYVGARECAGCHSDLSRSHQESSHALALIDARDDDFFLADFDAGEDVRTVTLPDDDETRPFEMDDIAFAVGMGRYVQRYLIELDRDVYAVLPAEWNTQTEEWQPYGPVEEWPDNEAYTFGFSCAGCHTTGLNVRREEWEDDGVQCEACHGPGSEHVDEAEDAGNSPSDRELRAIRGAIVLSPDPMICGQCHIRGTEPEDNHPYPIEYLPTENLLDENIFTPVPPDDEAHWWATGHAKMSYMQFNEWMKGAHSTALTSAKDSEFAEDACLECHSGDYRFTQDLINAVEEGDREGDPPDSITLENAEYGVVCTTCHNPHADPEEANFYVDQDRYGLCVDCHTDTDFSNGVHHPAQQMFEGQTIFEEIEGIASAHFTHEDGPDCITCHMPRVPVQYASRSSHLWQPVMPGEAINLEGLEDSCSQCHSEQIEAMGLQAFIDEVQASTETRLTAARDAAGNNAPEWVIQALDFVQGDASLGVHNYPYSDALLDRVEIELGTDTAEATAEPPVAEAAATEVPADTDTDEAETAADDEQETPEGLTTASITVMVLSLLLLAFAGWVFFIRQGDTV